MSNYQRCKARIYPKSGTIDLPLFHQQAEQLKAEYRIYDNLYIFLPANRRFAELHFTNKWYLLDEVFSPAIYDIWLINSDEGGAPDSLSFMHSEEEITPTFRQKALFAFDRMSLYGNGIISVAQLKQVFGRGAGYLGNYTEAQTLSFDLQGHYTANNFFYEQEGGEIITMELASEATQTLPQQNGEIWDMLFHGQSIAFKENFYNPILRVQSGTRLFPWLQRIELYYKDRISNVLEWKETSQGWHWGHSARDGFWNCINPEYYAYSRSNETSRIAKGS